MKPRLILLIVGTLLGAGSASAQTSSFVKLMPQPKEFQLRAGAFQVGPDTRILVEFGHQEEDRIAAETLAEDIKDESGLTVNIFGAKVHPAGKAIILARLQDPHVRKFLASKGLHTDSLGDEGYLLFSDHSHVVVAANTGQGLFSGVQMLRQLLQTDGKYLFCPGVVIRDWPSPRPAHG